MCYICGSVAGMKRALLIAVILLALGVSETGAQTVRRLHLRATPVARSWRHRVALKPGVGIKAAVYARGREIDQLGWMHPNECEYTIQRPRLALTLRWCGRRNLSMRYLGSTPFTVVYWLN